MKNALTIVALASCITAACRAATPAPVPENLLACGKLQDPGERVRCYDTQIAAMKASSTATPAKTAAPPPPAASTRPAAGTAAAPAASSSAMPTASGTPPAAPVTAVPSAAQFGEENLPRASHPAKAQQETALLSSITGMRAVAPETYAISLANGQVWRQGESSQVTMFFHVGDDVRIEKAGLGSYHMSTAKMGSKNWVRVVRIQ